MSPRAIWLLAPCLLGVLWACHSTDDTTPGDPAGSAGAGGGAAGSSGGAAGGAAGGGAAGAAGAAGQGQVSPETLASRGACAPLSGSGTTHDHFVTGNETWTAAASPHRVTADIRIDATVTIEACAVVLVGEGKSIQIGTDATAGRIVARGLAPGDGQSPDLRPILFDAIDPTRPWGQLLVEAGGTLDLSLAVLRKGGAVSQGPRGALVLRGLAGGTNTGDVVPLATLDRVLITGAASHGLTLEAWGAPTDASTRVWVRNCGSDDYPSAVRIEPGVAATLPAGLEVSGNRRDEILMTTSKTFTRDDRLGDHGVPYHQKGVLYLNPGADGAPVTLTIDPGVTLAFEQEVGSGIEVGSSSTRPGVLVAEGTEASPVRFTSASATPAPGDWESLYFRYFPLSGNHVSHAIIEYAGRLATTTGFGCGPSHNDAAVVILGQGPDEKPPASAFLDHCAFDHDAGTTVIVSGWVDDTGPDFSESNTFGSDSPGCKVSRPQRTGAGDRCDGGRAVCWP
jgi:hypothetical protein